MQEERQKRDQVKLAEKKFIDVTQQLLSDVFQKLIFEHHRNNIIKVSECFKNNPKNLAAAQECSRDQQLSQLKVEQRVEKFLKSHQEGVSNCIGACSSNIYTPMADCYKQCFDTFIEYSQNYIQKSEIFQNTEMNNN